MSAPVVSVEPICPDWCEVSREEHLREDPEGVEAFNHYRQRVQPNECTAEPSRVPTLSQGVLQPLDGTTYGHPLIMLTCNTYLTQAEARELAAALIEAADNLDRTLDEPGL